MIDSIIITGILILLTISEPTMPPENLNLVFNLYTKIIILITLLPFSISAITEIKGAINDEENNASKKGLRFMRWGFTYLIFLVALIIMGQLYPILSQLFTFQALG